MVFILQLLPPLFFPLNVIVIDYIFGSPWPHNALRWQEDQRANDRRMYQGKIKELEDELENANERLQRALAENDDQVGYQAKPQVFYPHYIVLLTTIFSFLA